MDQEQIQALGVELYDHLSNRTTMAPLTERFADITVEDAYHISRAFLDARLTQGGERLIGKKIGVTSPAVQEMLGVYQPDFGFLTDAMLCQGSVDTASLIAPRAEAEIAFRMARPLKGPGVTPQDVLDATESVMACFEIVDSRVRDWQIRIQDTVADNASCGVFVLGEARSPEGLNLAELEAVVTKNGEPLSRGLGSSVQGAPENAVAWLVNTLGEFGIPFEAGEIVLSGSLVPLAPAVKGDVFHMSAAGLGEAEVRFQ